MLSGPRDLAFHRRLRLDNMNEEMEGETRYMKAFTVACFIAVGASIAGSGSARAQTPYSVVAGHEVRINWAASVNPDCTSNGQVVMRITQPPQHGRVSIRNAGVFPNFPGSNVRNVCNTHRVRGVEAYYRPEAGYVGFDSVGFETVFPTGTYRQYTANIQVR
jgi:hypothetical protein